MRSIAFVDTYYNEVLKANPPNGQDRTKQLADLCFGTSNFYSEAFKKMGWQAIDSVGNDYIYNGPQVQTFEWLADHSFDIIYCQDLCHFSDSQIQTFKNHGKAVVGQISSKWPGDDVIKNYDILFTSFPHFIPRFKALGVRGEFLPIAFGEQVLDYVKPINRDIDISFVGGLGGADSGGYWTKGTGLFESVAKEFPNFQWWGYFIGNLAAYPNLSRAFRGPAWGLDQYKIYARSKIVINRHGEVAEGHTNNMRCFEATGMGALLFTEKSKNLSEYFHLQWAGRTHFAPQECIEYYDTGDIITKLRYYLAHQDRLDYIALSGQNRTLKDHTYTNRLAAIEPILRGLIK